MWGIRWVQLFFVGCWPEVMLSTSSLACERSGKASSKADPRTMCKSLRAVYCVYFAIYLNIEWSRNYNKCENRGLRGTPSIASKCSDTPDRLGEDPEQYTFTHTRQPFTLLWVTKKFEAHYQTSVTKNDLFESCWLTTAVFWALFVHECAEVVRQLFLRTFFSNCKLFCKLSNLIS